MLSFSDDIYIRENPSFFHWIEHLWVFALMVASGVRPTNLVSIQCYSVDVCIGSPQKKYIYVLKLRDLSFFPSTIESIITLGTPIKLKFVTDSYGS